MTRFRISAIFTCPSDWTEADARKHIEKICTGDEKDTVEIEQLEPPAK